MFVKVDLIVPAVMYDEQGRLPMTTQLCVDLPEEASMVTVSTRPLVLEAGNRLVWMPIRPYSSTAFPYVERTQLTGTISLTIAALGYETCFEFENGMYPREPATGGSGSAQGYKYFAQVVSIEVR